MILQNLILITAGLALLALAINWLYSFLLFRNIFTKGTYFNYQEYRDDLEMYIAIKGGISLAKVQSFHDCTKKETLVVIKKYIKDGFLSSKMSGENYEIADTKAIYDIRYDFIKKKATSSRSISHSDIKNTLSCDDNTVDRILIDLENDGIIGPVDLVESRLNESEREVLAYSSSFEDDEDYLSAKDFVIATGKASTSSLQTAFRWGYNTAARIINDLESEGVIGPVRAEEKYREVLVGGKESI